MRWQKSAEVIVGRLSVRRAELQTILNDWILRRSVDAEATEVGAEIYFQPEADGRNRVASSLAGDDRAIQ